MTHEVSGAADSTEGARAAGERLDAIAFRYYADPREWRSIAAINDISDPLRLSPGRALRIPSAVASEDVE